VKNGRLDEVLFTFDAVSELDVDPGSIGYFLCDLERKELIRRSRGYLYPFYDDRRPEDYTRSAKILALIEICAKRTSAQQTATHTPTAGQLDNAVGVAAAAAQVAPVAGNVETSVLQAALDDLNTFEPLAESSWLTSVVLFVPDHSIECPYPWTSVVASGLSFDSMDAFCQQAAPALLDICTQNNRDSLDVAQVFLRQQGCVASTLLEILATCTSSEGSCDSAPVVCKTQENGYCGYCLEEELTLFSPCEGSQSECWKCCICWAKDVHDVSETVLHFWAILSIITCVHANVVQGHQRYCVSGRAQETFVGVPAVHLLQRIGHRSLFGCCVDFGCCVTGFRIS
jgi:hypothetical protein